MRGHAGEPRHAIVHIHSVPHDGGRLQTVVNYPVVNIEVSDGTAYIASGDTTVAKTPA